MKIRLIIKSNFDFPYDERSGTTNDAPEGAARRCLERNENVPHGHIFRQAGMCQIGSFLFFEMCHYVAMAEQRQYFKQWRKHRGLTQEQLAERIGIARSYLTKIERGDRRWDQPFLEAAADALRCSPADLLVRDPSEPEGIWSIWDSLSPTERVRAVAVLKAMKGEGTGTDG